MYATTKMEKTADSAAMRESIATRPREGSVQGVSIAGSATGSVLIQLPLKVQLRFKMKSDLKALLIVFPIRVLGMFQAPQRTAAPDPPSCRKVVDRRWRRDGPFQRPSVPGIISSQPSFEIRLREVEHETQNRHNLENDADRADQVPRFPAPPWLIGIDSARHPQNSRNVHEVEGEMKADQEQPEMPHAQC